MQRRVFFTVFGPLLFVTFVTLALPGCRTVVVGERPPGPVVHAPGPPPHAPAHGHRRKHARHHDAELRFDTRLGVYIVIGHPGIYVHDGWYVRYHSGRWLVSANLEGPWEMREARWVPPGLRAKHHGKPDEHRAKHKGKGKGRGRGAAKGAW